MDEQDAGRSGVRCQTGQLCFHWDTQPGAASSPPPATGLSPSVCDVTHSTL